MEWFLIFYDDTYYQDAVDHLLSEGYIDQAKADRFTQNIDSESVQAEIVKDYTLYAIDLWVKDGYYSEETGKLEKQIVEAEYAGNDSPAEELRNKYMEQLENDELASFMNLDKKLFRYDGILRKLYNKSFFFLCECIFYINNITI